MHVPTGEVKAVWDVAATYMEAKQPVIILGGGLYGSGSSRDWYACMCVCVRAVHVCVNVRAVHVCVSVCS
jgi:aconitase A